MKIGDYSQTELRNMVRWVLSDGKLITDGEIVTEVMQALGFSKRGSKIVAAIESAVNAVRH